jgi:hypothetical protein
MTSTTRNNENNAVAASLLAPTTVSPQSQPSASIFQTQVDGGALEAPASLVPSEMADVPREFAPGTAFGPQTPEAASFSVDAAPALVDADATAAPFIATPALAEPAFSGLAASPSPSASFAGEATQPAQFAEPEVSAALAAAGGPVIAVATAHDDTIGVFCMCTACTGADNKPAPPAILGPAAGDDIPDDISSTVTIAVGGTLASSIQSAGDRDYIKVSLVAGQTYTISLESTGLVDPYVELRDTSNILLKENDDGGILYESFLVYTPTVTGDYFIVTRDYGSDTGSYALTVEAIQTGNSSPTTFIDNGKTAFSWDETAIQISRTGASWAPDFDSTAVVTYAYRSTAPTTACCRMTIGPPSSPSR